MTVSDDKLYDELCQAWRNFVSWRDRIFAGYLSVLAVLAYAFSQHASIPFRVAVFIFAILFSLVFRILDFRTSEFINSCQLVGHIMEGPTGFCGEFNRRRYGPPDSTPSDAPATLAAVTSKSSVYYTTAINLLVVGVVAISLAGLIYYSLMWFLPHASFRCWPIFAIVPAIGFALLVTLWRRLDEQGNKAWREDKTEYNDRAANGLL